MKMMLCLFATSMWLSTACASEQIECEFDKTLPKSIDEIVKGAKYIALFRASEVKVLNHRATTRGEELYEYTLTKQWDLKPDAPLSVTIIGLAPIESISLEYLAATHRHEKMTNSNIQNLGSTNHSSVVGYAECQFLPRFLIGANYLVLGGIDSPASYEFIADIRVDDWYLRLSRASREYYLPNGRKEAIQ